MHKLQARRKDLEAQAAANAGSRYRDEGLERNSRASLSIRAERERVWKLVRENDGRPVGGALSQLYISGRVVMR